MHDLFSIHYKNTIGVDFSLKVIRENVINEGIESEHTSRIQLWDIAGQELFGNMTRIYYQEACGAFVVCDATRPNTVDRAKKWKLDLDNKLPLDMYPEKVNPFILLVCKLDLVDNVDNNFYDKFCTDNGFYGWLPISNKTGENVALACKTMLKILETSTPMVYVKAEGVLTTNLVEPKSLIDEEKVKEPVTDNTQIKIIMDSAIKLLTSNCSYDLKVDELKSYMFHMYFNMTSELQQLSIDHKNVIKNMHSIITRYDLNNQVKCERIQKIILNYGLELMLKDC